MYHTRGVISVFLEVGNSVVSESKYEKVGPGTFFS